MTVSSKNIYSFNSSLHHTIRRYSPPQMAGPVFERAAGPKTGEWIVECVQRDES